MSRRIPVGVWMLGAVSLLMDVSSEIANAILPLYLTQGLMASAAVVGVIEGLAMATAASVRLFAGVLSDRIHSRKGLAVLGYGLAALSKPLFPLAGSAFDVALGKLVDRVGKGIRSAPRDALVADLAPPEARGAAFGVRKTLDTVGGFVGPLAAVGLLVLTSNDLRRVLWIATIPAVAAVVVLLLGVHEPPRRAPVKAAATVGGWTDALVLTPAVWWAIGTASLLTLARFSEAFLVLRAAQSGLTSTVVPLVLVALHLAFALGSYPAGVYSDRVGRRPLLAIGTLILVVAHLVLAAGREPWHVWTGAALWGLHMALTQGVLASLLSDVAPAHLRGSAFGVAGVTSGITMFLGNVVAGVLWQWKGAESTFYTSAALGMAVVVVLIVWQPRSGGER